METIVGEVLLIIIGNPDFLKVCAVFAIMLSVLSLIIFLWKFVEDRRS
jgi:hypothetical protein